jgi:AraC-like DNA-binding protein
MTEALRNSGEARAEIRQTWLNAVAREFQVANAIPTDIDVMRHRDALLASVEAIPFPDSVAERLLLRGLCAEFAYRTGPLFHNAVHAQAAHGCRFAPSSYVRIIFGSSERDPISGLKTWIGTFFDDLEQMHVSSPADAMATTLRTRYDCQWTNAMLGLTVGCTAARAVATFRRRFGLAPKDYLALVRLQHALSLVRSHKVEWVAGHIGYKSKKDFYRMFVRLAGVTPVAFRKLDEPHANDLREQISTRLHGGSRVRTSVPRVGIEPTRPLRDPGF